MPNQTMSKMNNMSKPQIMTCIKRYLSYQTTGTVKHRFRGSPGDNVAAFDLDHTLIKPKKNKRPTGRDDWMWMPSVLAKLKSLHTNGFKIVVFTNQTGKYLEDVLNKITDIQLNVSFPISVYCATASDYNYKPMTGMWDLFVRHNGRTPAKAFYCGDAAGRKDDFACSDKAFAENIGVPFHTPETMFLDSQAVDLPVCKGYPLKFTTVSAPEPAYTTTVQEIVVLTGYPGSGKSRIAKKFRDHTVVSKDDYKTRSMKIIKDALKAGKSVVVDDTNTNVKAREPYVTLAKKLGIHVRSVYLNVDINVAMHMNSMRHQMSKGARVYIPKVAYYVKRKTFTRPTSAEGFDVIAEVGLVLDEPVPPEYHMQYNLL